MTYEQECEAGREYAARLVEGSRLIGNPAKLSREIQNASQDEGGYAVGFLHEIAELAMRGESHNG